MALSYVPVLGSNTSPSFKDLEVKGTLTVDGATDAATVNTSSDVSVGGNLTVTGTSTYTGGATFNGGVTVFGASSLGTVLMGSASATQATVTTTGPTVPAVIVETTGDTQPRLSIRGDGRVDFGAGGSTATDATLYRSDVGALKTDGFLSMATGQSEGTFSVFGGQLSLGTAGVGIAVKEGTNATMGTVTLVTGSATINTSKVTANSRIFLTVQSLGTVTSPKPICVFARTPGTSFQIASSDATDTSVIAWWIVEPA